MAVYFLVVFRCVHFNASQRSHAVRVTGSSNIRSDGHAAKSKRGVRTIRLLPRCARVTRWLENNLGRGMNETEVLLLLVYVNGLFVLFAFLDSQVALSVMMTTITTLGAIVMTPLLCKLLLGTVVPVDAVGIAVSTIQVRRARYRGFLHVRGVVWTFRPSVDKVVETLF